MLDEKLETGREPEAARRGSAGLDRRRRRRASASVAALALAWSFADASLTTGDTRAASQMSPSAPHKLAPEILELACAPRVAHALPSTALRVLGSQDPVAKRMHAPGDLLVIEGGSAAGIQIGQLYYVRRLTRLYGIREPSRGQPLPVHTNGWIQITSVGPEISLASIVYSCDSVDAGDFLEPFELPTSPVATSRGGQIRDEHMGRVIFGDEGKRIGAWRQLVVIDIGSDHGVTPGERFVILREKHVSRLPPAEVAEAIAVAVRPESSTIQLLSGRDAVHAGDLVAVRRP